MVELPKIISISSRVHEELNIIEAMDNKLNFSIIRHIVSAKTNGEQWKSSTHHMKYLAKLFNLLGQMVQINAEI